MFSSAEHKHLRLTQSDGDTVNTPDVEGEVHAKGVHGNGNIF